MAQKNKKYTKQQVSEKLGIQSYIMDSWEKQFDIVPLLLDGEKIYTRKQLSQLRSIKELLYEKGLALDAAKKYFKDHIELEGTTLLAASPLKFDSQKKATSSFEMSLQPTASTTTKNSTELKFIREKLNLIREQLRSLSKSL